MTGKILVVSNAAYPIPSPSGRHLYPGEIAEVDDTDRVRQDIADGRLYAVPKVTPPALYNKPRARTPKPEEGASE